MISRPGLPNDRARTAPHALLFALLALLSPAAPLAANPAGRLEPGYSGWQEVRTEHFVFIFEERDAGAVRELVLICESVYDRVTGFLQSRPKRVWVVVKGRVDEANGYTQPLPAHIDLYLAPPSEPLIGLDSSSYLRLLLTHELTHYVNFEYDRGFFHSFALLFGPAFRSADMAFLPIWFIEGLATQAETLFTDGGRGRNPFFTMEARALLFDNRFVPLEKAAYSSAFPPADRDWLAGYYFFQYLFEHYGMGVLTTIHDDFARFPFLGPWGAIKRATGKSAGELYAGMIREERARYEKELSIPAGRRISPSGDGDYFLPEITARGWYLYRSTPFKAPAIVQFDPATQSERVLLATPLSDASSLSASRNGRRVVFASFEQTSGKSGTILVSDLFEMEQPSGRVRRLTTGADLWQPRLSPDGKSLIAVQRVGELTRLVWVSEANGAVRPLFSMKDAVVSTPAFSPDGSLIAFSLEVRGKKGIWIMPAPGNGSSPSAARPVIPLGDTGVYYPRFIDDGRLLFSSDSSGSLALYSISIDGKGMEEICTDPVGVWAGEASGGEILYASERSTGFVLLEKGLSARPVPAAEAPAAQGGPGIPQPAIDGEAPRVDGPQKTEGSPPPAMPKPRPYRDLPRFLGWIPLPFYYSTIAANELILAPGFLLEGASNLGRSSYLASASLRTDVLQPAIEASYSATLGTLGLTYALSEGYLDASAALHEQELRQSVSLRIPLVSRYLLGRLDYLALSPGLTDTLTLSAPSPFAFTPAFSPAGASAVGGTFGHDLAVALGLDLQRSTAGSSFDLFPRHELIASLAGAYHPPLLADSSGVEASGLLSVSIPSPIPHEVIALGLKTSYVTLPPPFQQITNPRGAFDTVLQSLPGRTLLSLDYLFPIALLDRPLEYSLGLVGIGGGLHVEAAADWSPGARTIVPDSDIYTGAEILLEISTGEQSFPLGIGLAFKFDSRFTKAVDWATDLRPYLYFSTSSFASSLTRGRP